MEEGRRARVLPALALQALCFAAALLAGPAPAPGSVADWSPAEREALEWLRDLVAIDTSNPPGDVSRAVAYLERLCRREGLETKRYEINASSGRVALRVRLPGRGAGKPLLLLCHLDVVPADPARWRFPPFDPVIRGEELWGRGTLDMKGQGVIELAAIVALKREGFRPSRDVLLLFNPDEETGGTLGAQWMAERRWEDLDPIGVLDEGSSGGTGLYTDDGRIVFGISVEEKRVLWLRLVAEGKPGHGSMPSATVASERLARALPRVLALQPAPRAVPLVVEMERRLGPLADNDVMRALRRTTLTLTALKAGVGDRPPVNVIPGRAEAAIDCRLLPGESASAMIASVEAALAGTGVSVEVVLRPADVPPAPWDTPLFAAIERTIAKHVPEAVVTPVMLTGGTDARFFRARGVPAYGFEPMVRTPEEEELIHGDDERIRLPEFRRGLAMYRDLLRDYLSRTDAGETDAKPRQARSPRR